MQKRVSLLCALTLHCHLTVGPHPCRVVAIHVLQGGPKSLTSLANMPPLRPLARMAPLPAVATTGPVVDPALLSARKESSPDYESAQQQLASQLEKARKEVRDLGVGLAIASTAVCDNTSADNFFVCTCGRCGCCFPLQMKTGVALQ